jgi:UrcA family protein
MATPKHMMLSLTLACAAMTTTPVMASIKTQDIRHADLDLSSAEGRALLQTRIRQAVLQVCGSPPRTSILENQSQRNCEKAAYLKADLASERVVAAYMEKRGLSLDSTASVTSG